MHRTHSFSLCLAIASVAAAAWLWQPGAVPKPRKFSSFDPQANQLLGRMTLEEKIGQMTQPDQTFLKSDDDIARYALGSVLSGGNSDPKEGNSLEAWTNMYDRYQSQALKSRLAIPLLYGVDAVHGHNNVLGAVIFPHNVGLGATRNPALIERIARITAEEVRATGINWTFAPCVTVPRDIRWGRTYEGFSEDPGVVKELGAAAVRGFQFPGLDSPLAVLACAKHYVGDGGTAWGTGDQRKGDDYDMLDRGDVRLDEATLRAIHLPGYITAIRAGAGTIMPSYSSWNGVKCSGSKRLLTEILKEELGFEGFLISDYGALRALPGAYKDQLVTSINAGMDMVMVPDRYPQFIATLKAAVEEGRVAPARIDDAVRRILRVKFAMGLMDKSRSPLADRSLWKTFGSPEHRKVARDAVRRSIVLLKNDNKTLPLAKTAKRIHVAGKSADDLGNQCGGWSISWLGAGGAITPGGTTILAAIRKAVSKDTAVTFTLDGDAAAGAGAGVVVIGENPYAETAGDRTSLALAPEDVAAVKKVKAAGIPVVVVLISGRPMILDSVLDQADAIIAAWLPGTEGDGVADVLFGDYKPTGKLSFSWPRSMAEIPSHPGDKSYDPLFKFGYGLSW
jgi:beta-glucosidase